MAYRFPLDIFAGYPQATWGNMLRRLENMGLQDDMPEKASQSRTSNAQGEQSTGSHRMNRPGQQPQEGERSVPAAAETPGPQDPHMQSSATPPAPDSSRPAPQGEFLFPHPAPPPTQDYAHHPWFFGWAPDQRSPASHPQNPFAPPGHGCRGRGWRHGGPGFRPAHWGQGPQGPFGRGCRGAHDPHGHHGPHPHGPHGHHGHHDSENHGHEHHGPRGPGCHHHGPRGHPSPHGPGPQGPRVNEPQAQPRQDIADILALAIAPLITTHVTPWVEAFTNMAEEQGWGPRTTTAQDTSSTSDSNQAAGHEASPSTSHVAAEKTNQTSGDGPESNIAIKTTNEDTLFDETNSGHEHFSRPEKPIKEPETQAAILREEEVSSESKLAEEPVSNLDKDKDCITPPMDLFNLPDAYIIHIPLPGAKDEDVWLDWNAERGFLTISGVLHPTGGEQLLRALRKGERKFGLFERAIKLPEEAEAMDPSKGLKGKDKAEGHRVIEGDAIHMKLEHGLLVVTVPKVVSGDDWVEL